MRQEENERLAARLRGDLQQQLSQLHSRLDSGAEARELMQENHDMRLEIERLQLACEKLKDQVSHLRGECRTIAEANDMLKLQLSEERSKHQAVQSELQAAQLEIQRLLSKNSSLE
jgi:hypothetical protein